MSKDKLQKQPEIKFDKQLSGYDREQVDRYIKKITQAYQTAYDEYNSVRGKYTALLEKYSKFENLTAQTENHAKAMTKSLIGAETMAQKIIADARAQAAAIMAQAMSDAEKIKGDAYIERAAAKRSTEVTGEYINETISKLQQLVNL